MRPYICISYAAADTAPARAFLRETARYGFYCETPDASLPRRVREKFIRDAVCFLALTSPAAADDERVVADIRFLLGEGLPVVCVSLEENTLDRRFCGSFPGAAIKISYPAGDAPDRAQVAYYIHQLYISRLCRHASAFSVIRCVDDANGRLIKLAVAAHRVCSGESFSRRDEHIAAVHAVKELADAYRNGKVAPRIESEAVSWLERGASLGQTEAMLALAEWKLEGGILPRDPAGAMQLFSRTAATGDVRGLYHMGRCALLGLGMMRDPATAAAYLTEAASHGYLPAYYQLGLMKRDGIGLPADRRAAAHDLYVACAELTGYRLPNNDIHQTPQAEGEVVRIVEPRPARQILRGERNPLPPPRTLRVVSMRKLREDRLWRLLQLSPNAPLRGCMARCHYRPTGGYDSRRLRDNATNTAVDLRPDGWNRYDPSLAAYELGRILEQGDGTPSSPPLPLHALYWYRLAARRGHAEAILRMAECYRAGQGLPPSRHEAVELYRLSAELGDAESQFRLGVCYERGIELPQSIPDAMRWYTEAAGQDHAAALNNLGGCLERGADGRRDMAGAVDCYRRAAAAGQSAAACRLGLCFERGLGVLPDARRARELFEQATEAGHPYAAYRLGLCYDWGRDTPSRFARAVRLYTQAATGGIAEAAYALGLCYRDGRGVPRDDTLAYECFARAAEGCPQAALEAGLCLTEGQGIIRKPEEARDYFLMAAADHLPRGTEELWLPDLPADAPSETAVSNEEAISDLPPTARTREQAAAEALFRLACSADPTDPHTATLLTRSARLGNAGACLMLGDMFAGGMLSRPGWETADAARLWYERASDSPRPLRTAQDNAGATAHLRLALDDFRRADLSAEDTDTAERHRKTGWKHLVAAAGRGNAEAAIRMSECSYRGMGTERKPAAAKSLLLSLRRRHGARYDAIACLWLGHIALADGDLATAIELYREAANAPVSDPVSHPVPYDPALRDGDACRDAEGAAAEAMYRLAILGSVTDHLPCTDAAETPFAWLCRAIRAGHAAARRDFARMLTEAREQWVTERRRAEEAIQSLRNRKTKEEAAKPSPIGSAEKLSRLLRVGTEDFSRRDPTAWMKQYYRALAPAPLPFRFTEETAAIACPADGSEGVTCREVTSRMSAEAMYYLGECLFQGLHLPQDRAAAVSCYREAAAYTPARGEPPCQYATEAQYSLGWCLVRGVGCPADPQEGVTWLSRAARQHGEAAYMLAECCEAGIGMDMPDSRAAVSYYRRALKLGCRGALAAEAAMEKALRGS